jgi:hypothetical protein
VALRKRKPPKKMEEDPLFSEPERESVKKPPSLSLDGINFAE